MINCWLIMIIMLVCFFRIEGHAPLYRNPWPGYNALLLWLITGDLYSACPHRKFHTPPIILHSQAALSNSYTNVSLPSMFVPFMMVFGMTHWDGNPRSTAWKVDVLSLPNAMYRLLYTCIFQVHFSCIITFSLIKDIRCDWTTGQGPLTSHIYN